MPGGRPTRMNDVLHVTTDGRQVTVRDRILDALNAGNYVETACALAGVHKDTFYGWCKLGAKAAADLHAERRTPDALTDHEQECMEFSDAVAEAQARSEARDVAQLAELARGGRVTEVVEVKKDAAGRVVETKTRTDVSEPNAAVLQWRLERRFPDRWGRRRLEVTGADGGPVEVDMTPVDRLKGLLEGVRDRHEAASEAWGAHVEPPTEDTPPPEG